MKKRYLILEDGTIFQGWAFGADGAAVGELVFTTNMVGYVVSLAFNYFASVRFTFRVKSNAKKGIGFFLSHCINFLLQTLFLNLFLALGVSKNWAPLPMFAVCVPINFLLVRYFLKK